MVWHRLARDGRAKRLRGPQERAAPSHPEPQKRHRDALDSIYFFSLSLLSLERNTETPDLNPFVFFWAILDVRWTFSRTFRGAFLTILRACTREAWKGSHAEEAECSVQSVHFVNDRPGFNCSWCQEGARRKIRVLGHEPARR